MTPDPPVWKVHIVVVPKRHIASLTAASHREPPRIGTCARLMLVAAPAQVERADFEVPSRTEAFDKLARAELDKSRALPR